MFQTALDVPEANAGVSAPLESCGSCPRACVLYDDRELARVAVHVFDLGADRHLTADLLVRNAVFHGVLYQRLEDERWQTDVSEPGGDVNRDTEPLFEP